MRFLRTFAELQAGLGYPPTMREMCDALGFSSTNAASEQYGRLARMGLLSYDRVGKHDGAKSRVARLTDAALTLLGIERTPAGISAVRCGATTGYVLLPWRCPACSAETFTPARGCSVCRRAVA